MSVTLPYALADAVRARVHTGAYASESEVIREGLRALAERERAVEEWLRGPLAKSYSSIDDAGARVLSVRQVRRALRKSE